MKLAKSWAELIMVGVRRSRDPSSPRTTSRKHHGKIESFRGNLLDLRNGSPSSLPRARDAMREGSTGAEAPTLDNYFSLGTLFYGQTRLPGWAGEALLIARSVLVGAPTSSVSPHAGA